MLEPADAARLGTPLAGVLALLLLFWLFIAGCYSDKKKNKTAEQQKPEQKPKIEQPLPTDPKEETKYVKVAKVIKKKEERSPAPGEICTTCHQKTPTRRSDRGGGGGGEAKSAKRRRRKLEAIRAGRVVDQDKYKTLMGVVDENFDFVSTQSDGSRKGATDANFHPTITHGESEKWRRRRPSRVKKYDCMSTTTTDQQTSRPREIKVRRRPNKPKK